MPKRKPYQLGKEARKLDPKLRMIANGNTEVNMVRSAMSPSIAVTGAALTRRRKARRAERSLATGRKPVRGTLARLSPDVLASVFVETDLSKPVATNVLRSTSSIEGLSTAMVRLSDLPKIAGDSRVLSVSLGQGLRDPTPVVSAEVPKPPSVGNRRFGSEAKHQNGKGVLIGIIDVQGFDFAHPDFIDSKSGKSRWIAIWDQGGTAKRGSSPRFGYGNQILAAAMNDAIKNASVVGAPATSLEPQSQMVPGSHGTHVASIAAGNTGLCRDATIAGVLISLGKEDDDRRQSFYDSSRLAHAVDYLVELAAKIGAKALSINISLGTNGHSHDSSAPINRWIDHQLAVPGRSVCVAAGNAGQEKAAAADDIGYIFGRIHTSGQIDGAGLNRDIEWIVVGNTVVDVSENELEIWLSPQDRFEVSVRTPDGKWIGPLKPRQFIENQQLSNGSFISIYNELYYHANGSNYIAIYLSPFLSPQRVVGIPAGQWIVRLHGLEIRDGRYHAWIERDDPQRLGPIGPDRDAWSFPSFFSERTNVDNSSVSTLACGLRIVSVANLDEPKETINISSSQGPTRDGRQKPDIAAPGTDIVAAKGFSGPDDLWIAMTGTSMASPFVTGVIGLMFAMQPKLTAAQALGIIQRTAKPLPGHNYEWRNDAGFGVIDPKAALSEAEHLNDREDKTP